jgi:transposase
VYQCTIVFQIDLLSWAFFNKTSKPMSNKPISMTQVSLIQQLNSQGHSIRSISRKTGLHRKTVSHYLGDTFSSFAAGVPPQDESHNQGSLLGKVISEADRLSVLNGYFPHFDRELSRTGVTRLLLWEEYLQFHPDGYGYSQFCEHYSRYRQSLPREAVMYLEHVFGERLQIDFAGKPLFYIDFSTGELIKCPVLVCVLPASGYTYVEALASACSDELFGGLNRCLEYLGGAPRNVLSDNMRQFVIKNSRYEYTFTELALQWSAHYATNLEATRKNSPRDKASVEKHVHISYLRIFARLRNEEFSSLSSLNRRIRELLDAHNDCRRSRGGESRREVFLACERSLLTPLPSEAYFPRHKTQAKVQKNYHVELGEDKHFYSVPYRYIGQQTSLIYDRQQVEVFIGMERIAIHSRDFRQWGYSTHPEHLPDSHLHYRQTLGFTKEYFQNIARKAGPSSEEVFETVMNAKKFVEQSYNSCLGLKRLMEQYGHERFENACYRALQTGWINYGCVSNILKNGMDKTVAAEKSILIPFHENIRGADEYR